MYCHRNGPEPEHLPVLLISGNNSANLMKGQSDGTEWIDLEKGTEIA